MPEYRVTWNIDIDAPNPRKAAEKALEMQRDPSSIATVFEVIPRDLYSPARKDAAVQEVDLYHAGDDVRVEHLHFGVTPRMLLYVTKQLVTLGHRPVIDGDGWNTWGEAVDTDINDDRTLHLVVPLTEPGQAGSLVSLVRGMVEPMTARDYEDVRAVLTDDADWSEYNHGSPLTYK